MVRIVAVDANTGQRISARVVGNPNDYGTVTVEAQGYTSQTVDVYPGNDEMYVYMVPRFEML